jgi:hypothetical protein
MKINKTKHNTENCKNEQHGHHQKPGVKPGAGEGQAVLVSYKTPSVY